MNTLDLSSEDTDQIIKLLRDGKIGVMPTDTIYGIVGSALNPDVVEDIYRLRNRNFNKPLIILIANLNDLNHFNISPTVEQEKFLKKNWPNPLSVILSCTSKRFKYLHRGKKSLAFRMPKNDLLIEILKQTGPLVAPSANPEGNKPAETIKEAKQYFNDKISFYVDGGKIKSKPSAVVRIDDQGKLTVLRD